MNLGFQNLEMMFLVQEARLDLWQLKDGVISFYLTLIFLELKVLNSSQTEEIWNNQIEALWWTGTKISLVNVAPARSKAC